MYFHTHLKMPPIQFTTDEVIFARAHWEVPTAIASADKTLGKHERVTLASARNALFLPAREIARRLSMDYANYSRVEKRDAVGKLTLEQLREVAAAMDCEVDLTIKPKGHAKFGDVIFEKLVTAASSHPAIVNLQHPYRQRRLAWLVNDFLLRPKFRREMGWARQYHPKRSAAWMFKD